MSMGFGKTVEFMGRENKVNIIQQEIPVPFTSKKEFAEKFGEGNKKLKSFIAQITSPTAIIFPMRR